MLEVFDRWPFAALVLMALVGTSVARVEVSWCYRPTVNGKVVNTLDVACGEDVVVTWGGPGCGSHNFQEVATTGDVCGPAINGPNDVPGVASSGSATVRLTATGTRRFKCLPHCLGAGQHLTLNAVCPTSPTSTPAPVPAPVPVADAPVPAPKPTPKVAPMPAPAPQSTKPPPTRVKPPPKKKNKKKAPAKAPAKGRHLQQQA